MCVLQVGVQLHCAIVPLINNNIIIFFISNSIFIYLFIYHILLCCSHFLSMTQSLLWAAVTSEFPQWAINKVLSYLIWCNTVAIMYLSQLSGNMLPASIFEKWSSSVWAWNIVSLYWFEGWERHSPIIVFCLYTVSQILIARGKFCPVWRSMDWVSEWITSHEKYLVMHHEFEHYTPRGLFVKAHF